MEYIDTMKFDKWLMNNKEVSADEREIAIELIIDYLNRKVRWHKV